MSERTTRESTRPYTVVAIIRGALYSLGFRFVVRGPDRAVMAHYKSRRHAQQAAGAFARKARTDRAAKARTLRGTR